MEKVKNELEALQFCKENQCSVEFRKEHYSSPEHVILKLNAWTTVKAENLVLAVNYLVDLYHTPNSEHHTLEWYEENRIKFYY